jgi:uncharacterized protein (TIGR02246 family)
MSSDEKQIRELVAAWMTATRSGDVEALLDLMTEDVIFLVPGKPVMRKSAFAAAAKSQSGGRAAKFEGESDIQEVNVSGDWACMWSKLTVVATPAEGGAPTTRAGHTLSVFRRHGGRWLLARDANLLAPVPGATS